MPSSSSKKANASKSAARERRSSSRHSTPVSGLTDTTAPPTPLTTTPTTAAAPNPPTPKETGYLRTPTSALVSTDPSLEALLSGTSAKGSEPPSAKELHVLHDRIRDGVNRFMAKRSEVCDRSMRQLVSKRKEQLQIKREEDAAREQAAAVARELAIKKEALEDGGDSKKAKKAAGRKRSLSDMMDTDGAEVDDADDPTKENIPTVGAHGLARQDGVGVHEGAQPSPSPPVEPGSAVTDPVDVMDTTADQDDSSVDTMPVPLYERVFGKDPTESVDPTVYDIRPLTPDMSEEEIREIVNVLHWPKRDLRDLTAGDPPDLDLSNAKPPNQVNFSTFQTYVEPYIRPFTEEDVAFLKERGDRITPYVIPNRGTKSYKDIWAAEDGGMTGIDPPAKLELDPNEPRGSIEDMDDNVAETTEVSLGPSTERLMALLRPAPNGAKKEGEDADGDTTMGNGDENSALNADHALAGLLDEKNLPATLLPPEAPRLPPNLPLLNQDFDALDARVLQEFRHIGLVGPTEAPNYDAHADDEVAARLRTLQAELRRVSRINNVRKARILELTEERMAMQEYSNIADDLDNQVNAAYLKRNRGLASKPPTKKAQAAMAAQQARAAAAGRGIAVGGSRGVSEGVRALMQKRKDWIEMVGPVVRFGRAEIPGDDETVFEEEALRRLERAEREAEEAGEGGEAD